MGTELTTKKFAEWMDVNKHRLMPYVRVPEGVDPDAYVEDVKRAMVIAYDTNTLLHRCDPLSMLKAACGLVRYYVELGGQYPEGYIVPYKQKAVGIVGFRGLIKLLTKEPTKTVDYVNVVKVFANDDFQPTASLMDWANWKHVRNIRDPGELTHVYSEFYMPDGKVIRWLMSKEEIDEHGKTTSPSYSLPDSPWQRHWDAMASKTVIRIPISRGIVPFNVPEGMSTSGALGDDATIDVVIEPDKKQIATESEPKPKKPAKQQKKTVIPFDADALNADLNQCSQVSEVEHVRQLYLEDSPQEDEDVINDLCNVRLEELAGVGA